MKTILALAFALTIFAFSASAHEYQHDNLEVIHPVALSTTEGTSETIGFFRVCNDSDEADRLIAVSAPETSEVIQITMMQGDEAGAAQTATAALDIPANQETALTPNGNHILFAKLKGPLLQDHSFPAVLKFEKAGDIEVIFNIEGSMESDKHAH